MPQFDFAEVFWPQLIWLAIIFSVLYFLVIMPTLPKLGRVIDARENKVKGDIESAESAKAGSDAVTLENANTLAKTQDEARAMLVTAKVKAGQAAEKKVAAANAKIDQKMASAQADLSLALSKAMTEIETIAADSAADIVEKLNGTRPTAAMAKAAAKSVLIAN